MQGSNLQSLDSKSSALPLGQWPRIDDWMVLGSYFNTCSQQSGARNSVRLGLVGAMWRLSGWLVWAFSEPGHLRIDNKWFSFTPKKMHKFFRPKVAIAVNLSRKIVSPHQTKKSLASARFKTQESCQNPAYITNPSAWYTTARVHPISDLQHLSSTRKSETENEVFQTFPSQLHMTPTTLPVVEFPRQTQAKHDNGS